MLRYNVIENFSDLTKIELANIERPINFGKLPSLEIMFLNDTIPPQINKSWFSNNQIMDMKLWIPYGCKDIYMSSDWKFFWNIEEFIVPILALDFETDEIIIDLNESELLHPIITPSDASLKQLMWSSSAPSIVTVTEDGCISSNTHEGEAIITAATCDGTGLSTSVKVVVQEGAGISDVYTNTAYKLNVENGSLHIINLSHGKINTIILIRKIIV